MPADKREVAWRPTPDHVRGSHVRRLMDRKGFAHFEDLLVWSIEDVEAFHAEAFRDLGVQWYHPYREVLDLTAGIAHARWFAGARLNLVHNCLERHLATPRRSQPALIWEGEEGDVRRLTYGELGEEVERAAAALAWLGIARGDRVGIFMPMVPETVVAVLACAKVGAIFTPIFSGYAAPAVASRLVDCEAKLLITTDGFFRRGTLVPTKQIADRAVELAPSVERMLVVRRAACPVDWQPRRDVWWHVATASAVAQVPTAVMDADDPFMIIYTSGTTGRPKGALHVHAGFPLKATLDMAYCFDLRPADRIFWLTDLGWMMGPWEIFGALSLGGTFLIYDGSPDHPGVDRLWSLVERHRITHLGISPTFVRAVMTHGEAPVKAHDLSSLRVLGSTGEPWNPDPWLWTFRHVGGGRCPIINYSGGTEVSGGIVGCYPVTPLKPCSFAGPVLGMAADVVDEAGRSVRGRVGELVVRKPWPGMTRGFWRDPERYRETYWGRWPDVWVHGDWAMVDEDGFWFIQGRSDDTIMVAGKRVGPAEVESILVAHPAVREAAAIGVPHPVKGEAIVGFVALRPGHEPSEELRRALEELLVGSMGKALRPEAIRFVRELPRTRNAKILRRLVKKVYLGHEELGDTSALENPEAVEEIRRSR